MPRLDLEAARRAPVAFDEMLEVSAAELDRAEVLGIEKVHASGELTAAEAGFQLEADLQWRARLECARCLQPFDSPSEVELRLLLLPAVTEKPEVDVEYGGETSDFETAFYSGAALEILPLALEQIQLALPMKPLCREDCRGLCSRCGANLNGENCACPPAAADPRFAELEKLRAKLGTNS